MSTTVSYKGSTIATVDNQTKTLLTKGKYLEDDITIIDSGGGGSGSGVWQDASGYIHFSTEPGSSGVSLVSGYLVVSTT